MPLSLFVLALASFGIGTTEFVIMGLLPDMAEDLGVSIPKAGMLVTGYALSVAIGAPIMALCTSRFQRKTALIVLMGIFILGNILCATASNYNLLMIARIITALCHGAFFGIGAIEAASLVPENRKASAVALMFTGLTLANVLGVPLGTALGQWAGWRSPFWVISVIGLMTFMALWLALPKSHDDQKANMKAEIKALGDLRIWVSLGLTVLFATSMFTIFTYITPILENNTGLTGHGVSWTLLLIGVGLTVGNIFGGRLADWKLLPALAGIFTAMTVVQILFSWTSHSFIAAEITLFLWGLVTFAAVPGLQVNVVRFASKAPNLISTLNIGAFNTGNAIGAAAGGLVIDQGLSLASVPMTAAVFSLVAVAVVFWLRRREPTI